MSGASSTVGQSLRIDGATKDRGQASIAWALLTPDRLAAIMRAAMTLTLSDFKIISGIIEASDYRGLKVETSGARLSIAGAGGGAAASPSSSGPAAVPTWIDERPTGNFDVIPDHLAVVRAPMVGTFYQAPSPDAPPFCKVGDTVSANDIVCLIEVMKLFNSITAGIDGTVVEIRADNETRVIHDQPLILIEPA